MGEYIGDCYRGYKGVPGVSTMAQTGKFVWV